MNNDFCSHGRTEASCLECKDKRIADLEYEKQVQSMAIYERNSDNNRLTAELAQARAEVSVLQTSLAEREAGKPFGDQLVEVISERDTLRAQLEQMGRPVTRARCKEAMRLVKYYRDTHGCEPEDICSGCKAADKLLAARRKQ